MPHKTCKSNFSTSLKIMPVSTYYFTGNMVALIVRGKKSPDDDPPLLNQHADCILSNGAPIGFFGMGNNGSSGNSSSGIGGSSRSSAGSSNSSGFGMSGVVYDFSGLGRARANYVDMRLAKGTGTLSTILFVRVSSREARAFDQAWSDMVKSPGMFNIVGWNCATHASQAFRRAGILSGGIPGLDTPNNLYKQLCVEKAGKVSYASGYVGFSPFGSGYAVMVETASAGSK